MKPHVKGVLRISGTKTNNSMVISSAYKNDASYSFGWLVLSERLLGCGLSVSCVWARCMSGCTHAGPIAFEMWPSACMDLVNGCVMRRKDW